MNKRNLSILVLIVVCALIIGLLVYYLIFYNFNKSGSQQNMVLVPKTPVATLITNVPQNATATPSASEPTPASTQDNIVQQDAGQVAKIFVERFGTWSNQAGAGQFSDLKLFVTAKMQTWVDAQVAKIIGAQADYQTAHIVRTQAVSTKVTSFDEAKGTASVTVSARRTDQTGDNAPKITNPEIKLEVIKSGKRWKVDSVVWQ